MDEAGAKSIVEQLLAKSSETSPTEFVIVRTQQRARGWIFFYTSREFVETRGASGHLAGNGPIYVKDDGRPFFLPTYPPLSDHIEKLEAAFESPADLHTLIPQTKGDFERARAAVALGYPGVEPILPALLICLQDMNWPVSRVIAPFLAGIGAPLAPYLRPILSGNDDVWKYWIVKDVIGANAQLFELFKGELQRIATNPTQEERTEEVDQQAREVLEQGPIPWQLLRTIS